PTDFLQEKCRPRTAKAAGSVRRGLARYCGCDPKRPSRQAAALRARSSPEKRESPKKCTSADESGLSPDCPIAQIKLLAGVDLDRKAAHALQINGDVACGLTGSNVAAVEQGFLIAEDAEDDAASARRIVEADRSLEGGEIVVQCVLQPASRMHRNA